MNKSLKRVYKIIILWKFIYLYRFGSGGFLAFIRLGHFNSLLLQAIRNASPTNIRHHWIETVQSWIHIIPRCLPVSSTQPSNLTVDTVSLSSCVIVVFILAISAMVCQVGSFYCTLVPGMHTRYQVCFIPVAVS